MPDLPAELYTFETRNRSTLYREEYCDLVIEMGKEGASQKEMAHQLGIYSSTFHLWLNAHPEFKAAVEIANDFAQGWWERAGRLATFGHPVAIGEQRPAFAANSNLYAFNMKNRFRKDWTDSSTVDHRSSDGSMSPRKIELVPGGPDEPEQEQEPSDA